MLCREVTFGQSDETLARLTRLWCEHRWHRYSAPARGLLWSLQKPHVKNRKKGEYLTDRITDETLAYIDQNKDDPFFLCLWHWAVHSPWGHKEKIRSSMVLHYYRYSMVRKNSIVMPSIVTFLMPYQLRVTIVLCQAWWLEADSFLLYGWRFRSLNCLTIWELTPD